MGKSYSLDLRERVYSLIVAGHSRHTAASYFDMSLIFAVKVAERVETTDAARPARQGQPPGSDKLAPYRDFLVSCVEARPDITMPELAAALAGRAWRGRSPGLALALSAPAGPDI